MSEVPAVLYIKVPEPYSREGTGFDINMGAESVTVMGVMKDRGKDAGLKESIAAWRKHSRGVGDALLNITEGVDKDEDRPPTPLQSFPTIRYTADGRSEIAANEKELKDLEKRGFSKPFPKIQVAVLPPEVEKKALMDANDQLRGQLAQQALLMQQMMERLDAMERAKAS